MRQTAEKVPFGGSQREEPFGGGWGGAHTLPIFLWGDLYKLPQKFLQFWHICPNIFKMFLQIPEKNCIIK